jgi:hypothetical protein
MVFLRDRRDMVFEADPGPAIVVSRPPLAGRGADHQHHAAIPQMQAHRLECADDRIRETGIGFGPAIALVAALQNGGIGDAVAEPFGRVEARAAHQGGGVIGWVEKQEFGIAHTPATVMHIVKSFAAVARAVRP